MTPPFNQIAGINSYQVWIPGSLGVGPGTFQEVSPGSGDHAFDGPPEPSLNQPKLENYPRAHLLSSPTTGSAELARVAFAGFPAFADRVDHYGAPAVWVNDLAWSQVAYREYGSTVLLPILLSGQRDVILSIGGLSGTPACTMPSRTILDSVQYSNASHSFGSLAWITEGTPPNQLELNYSRWLLNSVLLPDTRVFIFGGERVFTGAEPTCVDTPAYIPEVYDRSQEIFANKMRVLQSQAPVIRDYHSVGLLLQDGRVATGGGEWRHLKPRTGGACVNCPNPNTNPECQGFPKYRPDSQIAGDYQIFQPEYIACGPLRPHVLDIKDSNGNALPTPPAGEAPELAYGTEYLLDYDQLGEGASIQRVVLMRPGSVTHHSDGNQRCVELDKTTPQPGKLRIIMPTKSAGILPRGYYMLFIVNNVIQTTQGVPSKAFWVEVRG